MSNSFLPNILTVLFGIWSITNSEKPIPCFFLASFLLCPPHVFLMMQISCNSPKTLALVMSLCLCSHCLFSPVHPPTLLSAGHFLHFKFKAVLRKLQLVLLLSFSDTRSLFFASTHVLLQICIYHLTSVPQIHFHS